MKKILLYAAVLLLSASLNGQEMFRYNCADTLVQRITTPFFLSEKLIYFDSTYIEKKQGGSVFKIGKVCSQFGCDGEFESTGKSQAGWWLIENKIVICYLTPLNPTTFKAELKVWRYNHVTKRFVLIL